MTSSRLWAGASGYSFKEWKGSFYPEKIKPEEMLAWYAERLPTVEINNTFYQMPKAAVLENWAKATPEHFRFAIKASRRITHMARLKAERRPIRSRISTEPRSARRQARPGAVPAAAVPEEGPAAPERVSEPAARRTSRRVRVSQRQLVRRRGLRRAARRPARRCAFPSAKTTRRRRWWRPRRGATCGCGSKTTPRPTSQQWAGRLAATGWHEIYVYFMHEPTAPAYAQALMRLRSGVRRLAFKRTVRLAR